MRPFGRSFLPGPVDIHPDVLQATLEPMYFTFSPRMKALLAKLQPAMQEIFGTRETVLQATTAATGLMEASIRSGVRDRVLVVTSGFFGELYARVAEGCGKEVIRASVPEGQVLQPDQLERFLEGPEVDAVALVHSDTSTGALAPLPELARVVRSRPDVLLLVDGVTSVGAMAIETDHWGVDFLFTGSQKALALPPGLAFGVASPRYLARAESIDDRGWYLSIPNLVTAARKNLPLTTPALGVVHALERQLERIAGQGGPGPRYARHAAMAARVAEWVDQRSDVTLLAPAPTRSPAVSVLRMPAGRPSGPVVSAMEERGWLLATGLPPLGEAVLRVGHMGDLELEHLDAMLQDLDGVLASS